MSATSVSCEVCSLGCPSWFVLLFMSLFVLHLLLGWGGLVTGLWPHLQLLCVGLFCRLRLWPHPLLLFSRLGFLLWAFVRTWVGRLRSCLGSYLLLGVLSFPCPGFRWAVPAVWLSRRLVFSSNLSLGSFLSLPVFADGLGWLRLILGYPPSVAWLWRFLPWSLSGTCRLALVGLQCLWIPWSCGVPGLSVGSPVSGLVCVLPQSAIVTLLSLLLVGLTFGLRAGSPASG